MFPRRFIFLFAAALKAESGALYIGIVNYDINSANGQQREEGFREVAGEDARVKDMYTIPPLPA